MRQAQLALKRTKGQEDRLIEAYEAEAIDRQRLKEEMGTLKGRRVGRHKRRRGRRLRIPVCLAP